MAFLNRSLVTKTIFTFSLLLGFRFFGLAQSTPASVVPAFITPDTVCVNTPVPITNTSTGASNYYWNFCVASIDDVPTATNIGNPGQLTMPVFIDYAFYNGNYYGFLIDYNPGKLFRLDFGNSLLNNPTTVDLGNFGGIIPAGAGAEGIQVIQNEGKWYAIIVGGSVAAGNFPRVLKIDFGSNLTNPSPLATNWGNLGNMQQPIDLHVFKEGTDWYGLTVNAENNTITRFNFTNSFDNTPTGTNLGNIGNLKYPTGIYAIDDNGFWRVFVVNGGDNTRTSNACSLTRLDFGSSLLNTPTGVNLGNPGNMLQHPRDLTIMKMCGRIIGYAVNGNPFYNDLVKINFNNDLSAAPTFTSLGNIGNFNFPHSISKLFRVNNDVYGFITNVANNTITRLKFNGCTNSSTPNSTQQNPPPVIYNSPGVYNINLTVDDGLPTQSAVCRQVVVLAPPPHSPTKTLPLCRGNSLRIGSNVRSTTYSWSTGATTDSITITAPGIYWVESGRFGCSTRDSFVVSTASSSSIDFGTQQNLCSPKTIQFTSNVTGINSFQWSFGDNQNNNTTLSPVISYGNFGIYNVKLTVQYNDGCKDSLTKPVSVESLFDANLILNADTTICLGDSLLLKTKDSILNYCWLVTSGIVPGFMNGYVKPASNTTYTLTSAVVGRNLVLNGDFSLGNTGFTSDYVFAFPNSNEGQFWIGANPSTWNPGLSNCNDHTGGNGNMMTVNGSSLPLARVWSQTVSVTPNTDYIFATWIQSLTGMNPANLQFTINGSNLGNRLNASSTPCLWNLFSSTWNSGNNNSAVITIVNNNTIAAGNDFALDDIFFGTVTTKTDSLKVRVTGICDSIRIIGQNKVCSLNDTLNYDIYRSANCTQQYSLFYDTAAVNLISQSATTIKLIYRRSGNTKLKVAFDNGCKIVADSIVVSVRISPSEINLGPDISLCRDTVLQLHAGRGFESYQWQDGSSDSSLMVTGPGVYFVKAQNYCGTQFKDTFSLAKILSLPFSVQPANVKICKGDSVQFNASGGSLFSWMPAGQFNNPLGKSPKAMVETSDTFSVHITDPACLRDTIIFIPVLATDKADIIVSKRNDVNCQLDSTILKADGGLSYKWSPNLFISRSYNNQIVVKPGQTLTYHVQGINDEGCIGEDSVTVYFKKEGEQKLYVPNAFTPNHDGINDVFRPIFTGPASKFYFEIFNRWGQLLFHSNTPGEGWDGRFHATLQTNDVYVYYIKAEGGCNGIFEQKGTFVLIR